MMAARALCCALMLLLCGGVCSGENLILPSKLQNATQETALFKPISLPTETFMGYTWNFGSLLVINVVGTLNSTSAAYRNRISLDKTTLALELRNLTLNDSGDYILSVNGDKGSYTATTRLEVFERISGARLIGPSDLIMEGNSTTLTCEGKGTVDSIKWFKNNENLSPSSSITFSSDNRSVTISPIRRADRGDYNCTLINPVSSGSASYKMTVNFGPDSIRVDGRSEVEEEGNVELSCKTDSEPAPLYKWEFNGTEKPEVTTETFIVNSAKFSDSGNYTCIARNNVTKLEATASRTVVVKEKGSLTGGSLSPGAIAGIVIGVLLGVAAVVALIFCLKKRPKSCSKEDKQNGVAQNGGEHELNYAEVRHVQPDQSVVNMGHSTQTRHGTPAMVRANRGAAPNQGVKPPAPTEVTYSEVKK
uniref:Ig-like domain-containing protein n=1 Tax=Astyanax mexicanus TaxID=7994 RepID=A0A3B1KDM6_ASTMX